MCKIGHFIMLPGSGRIGDAAIVMPCTSVHALLLNRLEGRTPPITRMIVNQSPFGCVLRIASEMNIFLIYWAFHCIRD
jgi:hypothetical protein